MILACQNIEKSFDGVTLLHDASFHIEEREKAALVGINGAGKSTLFRIIVGELAADDGQVILSKGKTLGYLAQHQELTSELTIYDSLLQVKQHVLDMEGRMRDMELEMKHAKGEELTKLMEAYSRLTHEFELENGYAYKSELVGVLKGLGFEEKDFTKQVSTLSGGQKTRMHVEYVETWYSIGTHIATTAFHVHVASRTECLVACSCQNHDTDALTLTAIAEGL